MTKTQPTWYRFSHHDRYRKLRIVQHKWCKVFPLKNTYSGDGTVYLDGTWINDVPSFYLSLGEAINGPNGYFGGGLGALSDCLTGGFGVLPRLTVRLSHYEAVRKALDGQAWCRFHAELCRGVSPEDNTGDFRSLVDNGYFGDGGPADIARWVAIYEAALIGETFDCDEVGSYFDVILEVFRQSGSKLIPEPESALNQSSQA